MLEPSLPGAVHSDDNSAVRPGAADGVFRRLDPRYMEASRLGWWIAIAAIAPAMGLAWGLAWARDWVPGWLLAPLLVAGLCMIAACAWLSTREPRWVYESTSYAVSELGIEIRKGIFWKQVIDVPRSRIQHTDVMQGPLGRRFGIAKLTMHTAGTQHASVELDGLAREVALEIRDYLIREGEARGA